MGVGGRACDGCRGASGLNRPERASDGLLGRGPRRAPEEGAGAISAVFSPTSLPAIEARIAFSNSRSRGPSRRAPARVCLPMRSRGSRASSGPCRRVTTMSFTRGLWAGRSARRPRPGRCSARRGPADPAALGRDGPDEELDALLVAFADEVVDFDRIAHVDAREVALAVVTFQFLDQVHGLSTSIALVLRSSVSWDCRSFSVSARSGGGSPVGRPLRPIRRRRAGEVEPASASGRSGALAPRIPRGPRKRDVAGRQRQTRGRVK